MKLSKLVDNYERASDRAAQAAARDGRKIAVGILARLKKELGVASPVTLMFGMGGWVLHTDAKFSVTYSDGSVDDVMAFKEVMYWTETMIWKPTNQRAIPLILELQEVCEWLTCDTHGPNASTIIPDSVV